MGTFAWKRWKRLKDNAMTNLTVSDYLIPYYEKQEFTNEGLSESQYVGEKNWSGKMKTWLNRYFEEEDCIAFLNLLRYT